MKKFNKFNADKLNFEDIIDLKRVLKMPKEELKYISPRDLDPENYHCNSLLF